ncbi:hypothetical protein RHMOL_Rhmol09G0024100 [Rhododendron molle]|uniref:Uncharacterized protein n=1 Tax=Rhododendron molle TaxID=49168 RepID=A0ACC0MA66_RHOML|nr:hypothetical protein RHMOL_Rhmol09G0024100 [Rhododendron molle]
MQSTHCFNMMHLKHTPRKGNKIVGRLANKGVDQEDKMVSHVIPPEDIIPILEADMRGVAFERL